MTIAEKIKIENNNKFGDTLIAAANVATRETQNYEDEITIFEFEDGSKLICCDVDYTIITVV